MIESLGALTSLLTHWTDNFGRQSTHTITDLQDVPGEHDFSPERLRYYKNGERRFLEYDSDANYSETPQGHLLSPDADMTLTLTAAERVAYPVGLDLMPSVSREVASAPQAGDVVGGGYGVIDIDNFDPDTVTYDGTDADGYFWFHTEATGLDSIILAIVQGGTVLDSRTVSLPKAADTFSILEAQLNWYSVGPVKWTDTYTDIESFPDDPQRNVSIGAAANDDGKGPELGSHRVTMAVRQAAGNTGLTLEVGSIGTRASGEPNFQFKTKGHEIALQNTNTTAGEYQVLGALRHQPDRNSIKLRVVELEVTKTPGSGLNSAEVLLVAVDPSETNAPAAGSWTTPVEHNPANSIVEQVSVAGDAATPLTGPDQEGAGTDITGADTASVVTNPGGYQMGRDAVDVEGTGSKTGVATGAQVGNRELYDTDIALFLVDSDTAGEVKVQVQTEQNS